jgi:hypothetical protein
MKKYSSFLYDYIHIKTKLGSSYYRMIQYLLYFQKPSSSQSVSMKLLQIVTLLNLILLKTKLRSSYYRMIQSMLYFRKPSSSQSVSIKLFQIVTLCIFRHLIISYSVKMLESHVYFQYCFQTSFSKLQGSEFQSSCDLDIGIYPTMLFHLIICLELSRPATF